MHRSVPHVGTAGTSGTEHLQKSSLNGLKDFII